ncbi:F-box only protein 2-like [Aphis gossypii]|uniref:F-box domain-containing protein n=1 Tax=Aphis gossypii TaxID=80765 RepID=A0A9P0J6S3_APHGO|nr:F-box only protein 2-like [Aphis gossypii]CAH1731072.1 unnamed protein product [Aphis gossypii]
MEVLKNNQPFDLLPDEMLIHTLILIDAKTLLDCRLVCKRWQELIDAFVFQEKAALENKFVNNGQGYSSFSQIGSNDIRKIELPWYVFYVISKYDPFNRNLIKNHCGQDHWLHWESINAAGVMAPFLSDLDLDYDFSQVSRIPQSEQLLLSDPDFDGQSSFFNVDFRHLRSIYQEIIFKDYGLNVALMKTLQPKIVFSSWSKTRYQYILYRLQATIYSETNSSKVVTADSFNEESPTEWKRASDSIETMGHETSLRLNHSVIEILEQPALYNFQVTCSVVKILLPIKYKNAYLL